jgi:prepilin-type N-terminal cleavage/methylation domain-containing protein
MSNARPRVKVRGSGEAEAPKSPGFTLLEVLIATAIMSLIVTVIYTSFFTAGRNVEQAEAIRDGTDLARTLVAKISSDITDAYFNPNMNAPLVTTIFYGQTVLPDTALSDKVISDTELKNTRYDGLYLTSLTNWRKPDSQETDLWEVGYYFKQKPDGSGWILMRREKRVLSNDFPALEGGVEYEMTDRVASLQFRYYDGSLWTNGWDSRVSQKLPIAVEISLLLDDGSFYMTQVDVGR